MKKIKKLATLEENRVFKRGVKRLTEDVDFFLRACKRDLSRPGYPNDLLLKLKVALDWLEKVNKQAKKIS